ncbi:MULTISPECIES: hypothetical protein [unclassified Leptolyngbya]|uniref:hypothetical protein n=1 Tax=unclassified Leptolyngbya TaxID=2650499 RepID=UPI001689E64B|nr:MULTISPECIES: hypothetical protein [unclassified Leptolyngbya]MBD1911896.1 hypothetical protein [Leptolyngbya sp. FACHB-8]MBD2156105.1 hypothetical protein [Leptolyngbya sp. FACHB-16]
MTDLSRRLSTLELSQRILDMGRTGVYRESVFEALQPYATKRQIREAIAHAKQFGLHSVAPMRDSELGTYYQLDLAKYQSAQPTLKETLPLMQKGDLAQQLLQQNQALERMLTLTQSFWMVLAIAGVSSILIGWSRFGFGALSGAVSVAVLWGIQRQVSR